MSTKLQLLISILFFATLSAGNPPLVRNPEPCEQNCNFHLCRHSVGKMIQMPHGSINVLRAPGDPMNGAFCRGNKLLSDVRLRAPLVRGNESDPFVGLHRFRPGLIVPRFTTVFMGVRGHTETGDALTRLSTVGNQYENLDNLCVTVPLRRFRIIHPKRISRFYFTRNPRNCVSFRAVAPKLVFEVSWYSQDDFDITVTEPTNPPVRVSRFDTISENGGRLLFDTGSEGRQWCAKETKPGKMKRESIFYLKDYSVPSGTYKVEVHHVRNCFQVPTYFKVKVVVDGALVLNEFGFSNGDLGSLAAKYDVDINV